MRMRKKLIAVSVVLLVLGALLCGVSFAVLGFDFQTLNNVNYVTNEFEITDSFRNISVKGDTEDIAFVLSEDGKCIVTAVENEKEPHYVKVEDNTLIIGREKQSSWNWNFGFSFEEERLTVALPEDAYDAFLVDADTGDVTVPKDFSFETMDVMLSAGDMDMAASAGEIALKTDTGKISLREISAENISMTGDTGDMDVSGVTCGDRFEIETDTGRTDISDMTCTDFYASGDTGDLKLKNVIASGEFHIESNTGDVSFDGCDAEAVYVETDTGDVKGSFLTEKVFLTKTDTGDVDVPKTVTGGRCEITTNTGDISISVS